MTMMEIIPPSREAFVVSRAPRFEKTFLGNGTDFSAERDASAFLVPRGFIIGPIASPHPRGVMHGADWRIAKWFWLTPEDRAQLHGALTGNMRTGPVIFQLSDHAPAEALVALTSPAPVQRRHA